MTNSWNTPIEAFEHQYPLRMRAIASGADRAARGSIAAATGSCANSIFWSVAEVTHSLRSAGARAVWTGVAARAGKPGQNTLLRGGRRLQKAKTRSISAGDDCASKPPAAVGGGSPWLKPSPNAARWVDRR